MTDKEADKEKAADKSVGEMEMKQSSGDGSVEIIRIIGSFGLWQLRIIMVLSSCFAFNAQHFLVMSFFTPDVDHWCKPPEGLYANWSVSDWKNYSLPPDKKHPEKFDSCKMYKKNYSILPEDDMFPENDEDVPVSDCMFGWDYDTSTFTHSLELEYDLVCDREALAKTGAASFNAGVLFGVVISGQLSDIFGRKITIMGALICGIVSGIMTSFMPSLELFFLTRFILAMSLISVGTVSYVLMMEFIDEKRRTPVGVYSTFTWVLGYVLLPAFAYLVPNWRHLQLLISLPIIPFIAFWWLVPESIIWLVSQERIKEAEEIAREAVKVNKRNVEVDLKNITKAEETSGRIKGTILDLFKFPNLRKHTLNLYFNWFVNAFVYYGLSLGAGSFGGDLFINFAIAGFIEIPSYIVCACVIGRYGRRVPYSLFMLIGGVACIATAAFEKGSYPYDWPIVTLAMIGKFCIGSTFIIIYLYTLEIYPTPVRNVGLGSSSMCARIGSISAPYVDLLRHVHPAIPLVLFGVAAVLAGGVCLLLPETNNKPLPQTLEDAEK